MVIQRIVAAAVALAVWSSGGSRAAAWPVQSSIMEGCHERLTSEAQRDLRALMPTLSVPLPDNERWRQVAAWVLGMLPPDESDLSDPDRFGLTSLIIGVRAPDGEGHSTFDLGSQREMNLDARPVAQYTHALRAADDDYEAGDASAVIGTQELIRLLVDKAVGYAARPAAEQFVSTVIYVDFYGEVAVQVWAPYYYLGRAVHAVQDSFSHTIRSEADGFQTILHVMNFIEAITGELDEERDGLAHSSVMDDCSDVRTNATFEAARASSLDFFAAAQALMRGDEPAALNGFFSQWMTLRPGCNLKNDLCHNDPWLALARESPSGPLLGCNVAAGGTGDGAWLGMVLLLIFGSGRSRRKLPKVGLVRRLPWPHDLANEIAHGVVAPHEDHRAIGTGGDVPGDGAEETM